MIAKRNLMALSKISRSLGLNNLPPNLRTSLVKRPCTVIHKRNLQICGGKIKDKQACTVVPSTINENPEPVQSDKTGYHKMVVVESCRDNQCHNKFCDTTHQNVCSLKQQNDTGVAELGGGLTHTIPPDKRGIVLSAEDVNGETKKGSQKLVTETTTVPVDKTKFKVDEKVTEYVQQSHITKK